MKDEVRRILKLVQEGKLSADDAAELIEAFESGDAGPSSASATTEGEVPPTPPPSGPSGEPKDPLRNLVEAIEKLTKDATKNVNWQEVAQQARESASKVSETIRSGFESATKGGGFPFFQIRETRDVSLPISVPEGKTLRIENPLGDIKITAKSGLGQVDAHAEFRGSGDDVKAKADMYTLILEESDSYVTIRQPDVPGLSVDLDVKLGNGCPIEVRTQSGDVKVFDTGGSCRVHVKDGNVQLKGLDGQIEVSGHNGDLVLEDSTVTSCSMENKAGDVTLRRVNGNANIRNSSGDISLRDCEMKSLAIDGISGNVDVDLRSPVTSAVSVRTVSGNVLIGVPDGSDCRVSLKALRGNVTCAIPLHDEARADGQVTGKLGEGKGTLDASSVNGNITVEMHVSF